MSKTSEATSGNVSEDPMNDLIIDAIQDIKGKNIVKLDLRNLEESPTDFFIICEGESNTQLRAIAQNVRYRVKTELNTTASRLEGEDSGHWICIDFFNTVVHVFYPETREFYQLEDLWSDAEFIEYENL